MKDQTEVISAGSWEKETISISQAIEALPETERGALYQLADELSDAIAGLEKRFGFEVVPEVLATINAASAVNLAITLTRDMAVPEEMGA